MSALTFDSPFCECDDIHCQEHVPITWKRYRRIHDRGSVVLPAHVPRGQREVEHGEGYCLIPKDAATARRRAVKVAKKT